MTIIIPNRLAVLLAKEAYNDNASFLKHWFPSTNQEHKQPTILKSIKSRIMNDKINIIDTLDEAGMLYLGLAELISAEVLVDIDSCQKAKLHLARFQEDLPTSRKHNDAFVTKFLTDAEHIIERELREFIAKQKLT